MILQFKTHILPMVESITPAVYHASRNHLSKLDSILKSFLHGIHVPEEEAFLKHNLAPLCVRRDIAMLALLHKCVLGIAHPHLKSLFPMRDKGDVGHQYNTRMQGRRHSKQLQEPQLAPRTDHMRHSLFGLIKIYNLLDASIVDSPNVKSFSGVLPLNWKLHVITLAGSYFIPLGIMTVDVPLGIHLCLASL